MDCSRLQTVVEPVPETPALAGNDPWSEGILSTVGNTPLVRLRRSVSLLSFRVFAKLEGFNPGGSLKDQPAARIVAGALERKQISLATTIVESSSGDMGIGLAQVCAYLGLCRRPENDSAKSRFVAGLWRMHRDDREAGCGHW